MTQRGLLRPGAHRFATFTDDDAVVRALVDVEIAWVRAQAASGLIPAQHADVVQQVLCGPLVDFTDVADLAIRAEAGGNPVIPMLHDVRAAVRAVDSEAAVSIHRGLTSQDVLDTALMVVAQRCVKAVRDELMDCARALGKLATQHRDTPCVARTLTQHAVPATFGLRCARWMHAVLDANQALANLRFPLAVGGAAGTLAGVDSLVESSAGMHPDGVADRTTVTALNSRWAAELGLNPPEHVWHTSREAVLQCGAALGQTAAALGAIANDVLLLSRPEIAELREPVAPGRGVSSAMPQKQNPVLSVLIKRTALSTPQLVAQLFVAAGEFVDERPDGAWHSEWPAFQDLLELTGTATLQAGELIAGLQIFPDAMRANLALSDPGLVSERLVRVLGPALTDHGLEAKAQIQEVLVTHAPSSRSGPGSDALTDGDGDGDGVWRELLALTQGRTLPDGSAVTAELIRELCDPAGYTGQAAQLVDDALCRLEQVQASSSAGKPASVREDQI
ncbi:lyase family protein [Kocuria sp.]|uniref:lyase family protein n=1 Tax=Kocuria sp. TaxID=1871328 RepID=UPI0026E09388|nr:lyase family protein [Kocuria sp.]MDO5617404.1 lyase family protein [Kocuria sp.]